MMIGQLPKTLAAVVVAFLAWLGVGSQNAMAISAPSADHMDLISFDLSGRRLLVPLPVAGLSKDVARTKPITTVDLERLQKPVLLVDELWDWRGSFWQGVQGSMAIKIVVYPVQPDARLECEQDLRKMLDAQLAIERKRFFAAGGQERFLPKVEVDSALLELGGASGLVYRETGSKDSEVVLLPITERSYLAMRFIFLRNGIRSSWRLDAEKLKEAILHGVKVEGQWPRIHKCLP